MVCIHKASNGKRGVGLVVMAVTVAMAWGGAWPAWASGVRAVDFVDHGPAAEVARAVGVIAAEDAEGQPIILAWINNVDRMSLLVIDAETGETEQFPVAGAVQGRPARTMLSEAGQLFAYGGSRLMVYDVAEGELQIIHGPGQRGHSLTEADDGRVYIGLTPNATLIAFDPQRDELIDHGSLLPESDIQEFALSLATDEAGWVYMGTRSNTIVAYDPVTGQREVIADVPEASGTSAEVFRGEDGRVYGNVKSGEPWLMLSAGQSEVQEGEPKVAEKPKRDVRFNAFLGDFPDGQVLREIDVPYRRVVIAASEDAQEIREIEFDYEVSGARIYSITFGPKAQLYGSTGHPLFFFRFDVETDESEKVAVDGGHLNAVTVQGGKVFGASYTGGDVYEYDPDQPWAGEGENPRVVASASDDEAMVTRPYVLEAHPDGRHVILGGFYDWRNVAGGGLLIYDMQTEEAVKLSKHDLLVGHSTRALVALPDGNLLGGTTVSTRGRVERKAEAGKLYILDWNSHEIIYEEAVLEGVQGIRELRLGPDDELVFGIADDDRFFVFDPAERRLVHEDTLDYGEAQGGQAPRMMMLGPDDRFYALFRRQIVQIDPQTYEHRGIGAIPDEIRERTGSRYIGIAMQGDRLYFAHGSWLFSVRLEGMR